MKKSYFLLLSFLLLTFQVIAQAPTTAATTPPARNTADVINLFSGAYTPEVTGTDWFPNWGQTTLVSDTTIVGNLTN